MKCNHCDTELRKESRFCFKCGKKVNVRDCYIKELETSGKALTRKTDVESLKNIVGLTRKIWSRVESNPQLESETRDLFRRYLPMITDVISRYREARKAANRDSSMREHLNTVKDDLTEVLNTTERALEIMLEKLYEREILELELNIETLQRLIESDGMVDPRFE